MHNIPVHEDLGSRRASREWSAALSDYHKRSHRGRVRNATAESAGTFGKMLKFVKARFRYVLLYTSVNARKTAAKKAARA